MINKIYKNKYFLKVLATVFSLVLVLLPSLVFAALGADERIITCGATDGSQNDCGFVELLNTANNIITFLLKYIATPLAAVIFAYAGLTLLFSGGNPGKMVQAKKIMLNMLIGYVIALAAWIIVKTILSTLGYSGTSFI